LTKYDFYGGAVVSGCTGSSCRESVAGHLHLVLFVLIVLLPALKNVETANILTGQKAVTTRTSSMDRIAISA